MDKMVNYIKKSGYNPDIESRLIAVVNRYPQGALERFYQTIDRQAIKIQNQLVAEAKAKAKERSKLK